MKTIALRVTEQEHELIVAMAKADRADSVSQWIRAVCKDEAMSGRRGARKATLWPTRRRRAKTTI